MTETIPAALAGERVDRVVALLTGLPRSEVSALIARGAVRIGGQPVATRSRRVETGDVVEVDVPEPVVPAAPAADPSIDVPVVWADADLVVVDKPAGLVVHPGHGRPAGTLVNGLLARFPDMAAAGEPTRPGIVHRLDAGTSGLLVAARTPGAYAALVAQLAARSVDRRYLALAWGRFDAPAGVVDAPIGRAGADPTRMAVSARGREARTAYEVVSRYTEPVEVTLLECRLETGRTHQIRVHLAAIDHPVVGDARYRGARASLPLARPFLHAARLAFEHPRTGERVEFESPLPADLAEVQARLRAT